MWCQQSMHCCEGKKRKLNIQKLTQLHNLSSVMTMCPSILASICASQWRESGKLRGLKCAQSVHIWVCTMPYEGCNQRTPCTTHRGGAAVRANINCEVWSGWLIGRSCESYQCVCPYNPPVRRHRVQWQTNAFNPYVCMLLHTTVSTVVGRWHSANCFMMIHCAQGGKNFHRWESELVSNELEILEKAGCYQVSK